MKKTIFWSLKENPLSITSLSACQVLLAKEDADTKMCLDDIRGTDLQLLINALSLYHSFSKELREINVSLGKIHTGQKVLFDRIPSAKKEVTHAT